jgi:hypothetical protein
MQAAAAIPEEKASACDAESIAASASSNRPCVGFPSRM